MRNAFLFLGVLYLDDSGSGVRAPGITDLGVTDPGVTDPGMTSFSLSRACAARNES